MWVTTNEGLGGRKHYFVVLFFIWVWSSVGESWWGEQKVSFIFSFLVLLKEMRMRGQSKVFPCFCSFRNFPPSQKLWKKSLKSTWTSVTSPKTRQKPRRPLKTTGYIHHTNNSTRSPFLHTQLQIKANLKRRIQLQNRNSKVNHPNTHDLTNYRNQAIHCHTEA